MVVPSSASVRVTRSGRSSSSTLTQLNTIDALDSDGKVIANELHDHSDSDAHTYTYIMGTSGMKSHVGHDYQRQWAGWTDWCSGSVSVLGTIGTATRPSLAPSSSMSIADIVVVCAGRW